VPVGAARGVCLAMNTPARRVERRLVDARAGAQRWPVWTYLGSTESRW
jgi:hypothetical protein